MRSTYIQVCLRAGLPLKVINSRQHPLMTLVQLADLDTIISLQTAWILNQKNKVTRFAFRGKSFNSYLLLHGSTKAVCRKRSFKQVKTVHKALAGFKNRGSNI